MSKKFGLDDAFPEEENENKLKANDSDQGGKSSNKEQKEAQDLKEEVSGKTEKSIPEKKERVSENHDHDFLAREREKFKPEPNTFFMNPIDAEIIRAVADKGPKDKTQGDLLSYFVDEFVKEKGIDKIRKALDDYRSKDEDGLF